MSRILDALHELEGLQSGSASRDGRGRRRFQMLTLVGGQGGVGKTTIALNLAVYLRALREDLPVLVIGLDDASMLDRMFALGPQPPGPDLAEALRRHDLASAIRLGQYGVHYVPTSRDISDAKRDLSDVIRLDALIRASGFEGLVLVDTRSDLEILTRNALFAADLGVVVVQDQASLHEAVRVFELLESWGRARERARILLSLVDLRVEYAQPGAPDVLALLLSRIRARGLPLFETFVSRSPKVESLYTNSQDTAVSILHGAPGSLVHRQLAQLADEVLTALAALRRDPGAERPAVRRVWS